MNSFSSLCYLIALVLFINALGVESLTNGLRCRDAANRNFLFHYASTNVAYTCNQYGSVAVNDYTGQCTHGGRRVFRFKDGAWQSCVNDTMFRDVACVIDEECALKSELIGLGIRTWSSQTTDGSCSRIENLGAEAFKSLISKFTTCDFESFSQGKPPVFTCDYSNYAHRNSSPDACKYGPDKYVFYVDNVPRYCIIRTKDSFNGLCYPMPDLWKVMKRNFTTYEKREHTRSSSFDYKHNMIEKRASIYGVSYGGYNGDFETVFKQIGRHLTRYFPERHSFRIDDTVLGANVFCDVALRSFPIESYQVYKALRPRKCPCVKARCVDRASRIMLNDRDHPYPKNLFMVWYDANKNASKCYLPQTVHAKTDEKKYCINFTAGAELIRQRSVGRKNGHDTKDNYQSYLIRLFKDPPNLASSAPWYFRHRTDPFIASLSDMVNALAFHNEPQEMEFSVGSDSFKLGISAFCNLLLELVPLSAAELTAISEEC